MKIEQETNFRHIEADTAEFIELLRMEREELLEEGKFLSQEQKDLIKNIEKKVIQIYLDYGIW